MGRLLELAAPFDVSPMDTDAVLPLKRLRVYYAGWANNPKRDSYPPDDGFYQIVRHELFGACAGIDCVECISTFCSWKSGTSLAIGGTVLRICHKTQGWGPSPFLSR